MKLGRALPLVLALAAVPLGAATAQFGGMPGMPGSPGYPGSPAGPGMGSPFGAQPQQPPPACQKLLALRDDVQKHGQALQAASQRKEKPGPEEMCKLFKAYLGAQTKMVKGLEEGASVCGVPAEVPKQIRAQQAKESQIGKQICDAAAQGPRPAGPSLSDALGTTPQVPDSSTATKRPGTFDTLEGSPLVR